MSLVKKYIEKGLTSLEIFRSPRFLKGSRHKSATPRLLINKGTFCKFLTGFTLLELLIVMGILAILAAVVVFILNPVEILKKARDSQRISDLATIKSAFGVYLTSTTTPVLDNSAYASRNNKCKNGSGTKTLYYSLPSDAPGGAITDSNLDSSAFTAAGQVTNANLGKVDGNGWLPINLTALSNGAPVSNWPIDPTNSVADLAVATSSDLVYRYACDKNSLMYEINAKLESDAFTVDPDNKLMKDGGNSPVFYEVGTSLQILSSGSDW